MRKLFRPIPLVVTASSLLVVYALIGFFLVPYIIKAYVLPAVSDRLQRPVLVREVAFNPFVLSLRMKELEIQEQDRTPLAGFQEFFVNFQTVSLFRRAYVFDQIRLAVPYVSAKVGKDGVVNLSRLGPSEHAAPSPPVDPAKEPAKLPAVEIGQFEIAQGIVEYRDESKPNVVSVDIVPINLVLNNFHTRPGGDNRYSFSAELDKDEILDWNGTVSLEPISSEGTLSLSGVKIATLFQYVQEQFHFDIPSGTIRAQGRYRFAAGPPMDLEISETLLHLSDIGVVEKGTSLPVIAVRTLNVDGIHADLPKRRVEIDSLAVNHGTHRVLREADGSLNVQTLLMPVQAESTGASDENPPSPTARPPWTISLKDARVQDQTIEFEDRSLDFPARTRITELSVGTHDVVFPFKTALPLRVEHRLNETGTVSVDGHILPQPLEADLDIALKHIAIQPFEPYLERFAAIAVDDGAIDVDGRIHFSAQHPKGSLMTFEGNLGVKSLSIADRDEGTPVAGWKQLQLRQIALSLDPTSVTIDEVGLDQPTVHLAIRPDGDLNVKALLVTRAAHEPATGPKPPAKREPPPTVAIKTVKLLKGTATFQDDSINPSVRTGLYDVTGTIKGLSSKQVAKADVNISGRVDKVAPLKITGKINPLTEEAFTDISVKFDNIDLTAAAPYSGKYVGYPIRKGKLFLDLAYKVSQKQLEAENKVAVDQLTLGEKTDSPDATSLPVPLAVALLKDRQGRIDIDLPIRGDLNDPEFKYGKVVISTLANLVAKMVASPFSLMGKLVPGGGDADEFKHLAFEPGSSAIPPAEHKKIEALMKGLEERPGLKLEITGLADPERDREALAIQQFQEQLSNKWRQANGGAATGDPPPAEEERLITAMFNEWRSRQPPATAQTPPQRPSIEDMKRALVSSIRVEDDVLRVLARTRAEQVHTELVGDGKLAEERVFLTDVDVAATDEERAGSRLNITAGS